MLPVEWKMEMFSLGNGRLKYFDLQCGVPVEWKREAYSLGYQWNETGRISVWVTGRIKQRGIQCGLPLEWNIEFFNMG